jgi:diguanylate cyclase (GGDEF)-like protein/PAS domain S-box-containing protein
MAAQIPLRRRVCLAAILAVAVACACGRAALGQDQREDATDDLARLIENHSAIMLLIDADTGAIIMANGAAREFYGYTAELFGDLGIQDINTLTEEQIRAEMALARAENRDHFMFRHRLADGKLRSVEVRSSPVTWAGRNALLSIVTDVGEHEALWTDVARQQNLLEATIRAQTEEIRRKSLAIEATLGLITLVAIALLARFYVLQRRRRHAEEDLREQHERLDNVVRATDIGTWEWNLETGEVEVNERFLSVLGRHNESRKAANLAEFAALVHPDDIEAAQEVLLRHLKGATDHIGHELRVAHADGHWIWLRVRGSVVRRDSNGRVLKMAGATRDVTSYRNSEEHLYHLAHYDELTGLPNRMALLERLQAAMQLADESGRSIAVAFIDLDDFKPINDSHGHSIGDEVLKCVGKRMLGIMRNSDTVARIGGDEFVAVVSDVGNESDSLALFHRLLAAASEPVAVKKQQIQLSASMGTTRYPQGVPLDADQLLRQADQAMYAAKSHGKNRIRSFDTTGLTAQPSAKPVRSGITDALHDEQLRLHYQPKVNMRSGELLGVEALLRWQHPRRGLLMPGEFLPLVSSAREVTLLGEWVLRSAVQQCSAWYEAGFRCPVSVNIDVLQLKEQAFTTYLANLLGEFPNLPDNALEIEILETGALEEDVLASGALSRCREMGIRISLDDFGTGFSSLSYLKSVPAETLKIDRSFVISMLSDPHDLSIIKGVLGLAQAFNREAIAEGVESEAHGTLLLRLGCEQAQGYGIAAALPPAELRAWAAQWRPPLDWTRAERLPREEHLILYAQVEMRHWREQIMNYLENCGPAPMGLQSQTGLGSWLKGPAARALRNEAELLELHRSHEHIQRLLGELRGRPLNRATRDIYRELGEHCQTAEQKLDGLIQRNAILKLGSHLKLVG